MNYTVIDEHGAVVKILNVPSQAVLEMNTPVGCTVVEGSAPANTYWDAAAAQWVSRGDKPSEFHVWSASSKAWGDPRSQAQVLADKWAAIRAQRDALLAQSDWRSIRAADAGVPLASAWLAYRQALRDITAQDPDDVTWPTAPAQQGGATT
jgi:hypothetical protein